MIPARRHAVIAASTGSPTPTTSTGELLTPAAASAVTQALRQGASVATRVGISAAESALASSAVPTGPSVSAAGGVPRGTKKPVIRPTLHDGASASAVVAFQSPPRPAANKAVMLRPTSTWIASSIRSTSARLSGARAMGRLRYRLASAVLRRSVISIEPGAWVMQNSGLTSAITAWGVTPQAQKTGNSSSPTGTGSP